MKAQSKYMDQSSGQFQAYGETVAFLDGKRTAQVTSRVTGYNGFVLDNGNFVGRMEGDGGKVALQFLEPVEYTYTLDHHEHLTGTIVVHQ